MLHLHSHSLCPLALLLQWAHSHTRPHALGALLRPILILDGGPLLPETCHCLHVHPLPPVHHVKNDLFQRILRLSQGPVHYIYPLYICKGEHLTSSRWPMYEMPRQHW